MEITECDLIHGVEKKMPADKIELHNFRVKQVFRASGVLFFYVYKLIDYETMVLSVSIL
jgi:hypothetical protein